MQIPKPTAKDKAYFQSIVPDGSGIEIKPMFGNLAAFVDGTMFMGLFGPDVGIRLSEEDRERLLDVSGAGPFGPEGRPMKEYVSLPSVWRSKGGDTADWVERARAFAAGLPPKKKR